MKIYTAPSLTEFGTVASLTADSGENNTSDTAYTLVGRLDGRGGSFDTCVFDDEGNNPDPACIVPTGD